MNKAIVIGKLHEIADHYLLGAGTWPADSGDFACILENHARGKDILAWRAWSQAEGEA